MPSILRNDDAEALILDIRGARTAAIQPIGSEAGAFLVFPTSVFLPGSARGQLVFPLFCDTEPGTLVAGTGRVAVTGVVSGVSVEGGFCWSVGADAPPPAGYVFRRRGREVAVPPWASQLPGSHALASQSPKRLAREQLRLVRQGRNAEHCLLSLTERLLQHTCRGPVRRALRYRPPIDEDDLVQRSLQVASRLLPLYASKDRPPCSWLGMLRLDGHRDLHREVTSLDWLPADAVAALMLADAYGIDRHRDPTAAWNALVEASSRDGQALPRIGPTRFEAAVRAPFLLTQALAAATTYCDDGDDGDDGDAGQLAAAVAALITTDSRLIALAGAGDPEALRRVGDQVVRRLSPTHERDGLWDEFRHSGQLFTTPIGRRRFGSVADPSTLATIDQCLLRVAGIRPVAAPA